MARMCSATQIDAQTGYRRYTTEQIQVAQIIRRFRDLDMPLHAALAAQRITAAGPTCGACR